MSGKLSLDVSPPAALFQSQSELGSAGDGRLNETLRRKRPSPRDFQPVHQAAKHSRHTGRVQENRLALPPLEHGKHISAGIMSGA